MKKLVFLASIGTLFAAECPQYGSRYDIDDTTFTKNGWVKPLARKLTTSTGYDYDSCIYLNNHKFRHAAIDFVTDLNESVYAIDDGVVYHIKRINSSKDNESVVYIRHKSANGEFTGVYGHVYAESNLENGQQISKGAAIGKVQRYGDPDHLHFEIDQNVNKSSDWGSIKSTSVNPLDFLKNNSNESTTPSEIHGVGSLIAPNAVCFDGCYGLKKDWVVLHPTKNRATAIFQWKYDATTCEHIKISAFDYSQNKKGIELKLNDIVAFSGGWSTRGNDKYYELISGQSMPIRLGHPRDPFNLSGVSLKSEVTKKILIEAECQKKESFVDNKKDLTSSNKILTLANGSVWAGNGSLISREPSVTFGSSKDEAIVMSGTKGTTLFQWQKTQNCKTLKIEPISSNQAGFKADISIRKWDSPQSSTIWGMSGASIPFAALSTNRYDDYGAYYIVEINTNGDVGLNYSGNGRLGVFCNNY